MSNNKDVKELLDMKYFSASRFKETQRKLTIAKNTIATEALGYPLSALFTAEEQDTLRKAMSILDDIKNKVEHAKEIRAREEKRRDMHLKHCAAQRNKIISKHLIAMTPHLSEVCTRPGFMFAVSSLEEHLEMVTFHLSLVAHKDSIARGSFFGYGIGYIEDDLARGIDKTILHATVKSIAPSCRHESFNWIEQNLWRYDEEPDPERMTMLLNKYREEWRSSTIERHQSFLERYKTALLLDLEQDEKIKREIAAKQRRAEIKSIK